MYIHIKLVISLCSEDLLDVKHDGIKRRVKASMITRVVNHAMDIDNHSDFSSDIYGCPGVPQRILLLDCHLIADSNHGPLYANAAD